MKNVIVYLIVTLFFQTTFASDYRVSVMPDTSQLKVATIVDSNTITISIQNLSQHEIVDLYISVNSSDTILLLENIIDGSSNQTLISENSFETIYPNQYTTHITFGIIVDSLSLKFQTSSIENLDIIFCGKQPFAFFGIAQQVGLNCCVGMRGNLDYDQMDNIDISDLIFLVDFMFRDGAEPLCYEEANIDGLGIADISDLILLVAYMFQDGPSPEQCP